MHGTATDLPLTAAYWRLGLIHSDDVVRIALEALEAGLDTPTLRILAGESGQAGLVELAPMFDKVLRELNVAIPPTEEEAAKQVTLYHARRIVAGEVTPWEGAHAIELEIYQPISGAHKLQWLMPIMAQAFQHEEYQVYSGSLYTIEHAQKVLKEIDADIIKAAHELINVLS
jgi:hypothetical protein